MSTLILNSLAPDFSLPATDNGTFRLSEFTGKNDVVLYFYPKDCTSGCTLEGQQFRDHYADFQKLNVVIAGISRDTLKLHEKFKNEHAFPFPLLSDKEETVCQKFGVIKEKIMYGKKVKGIERSTFLIDKKGYLIQEWRKVKADGHAAMVLAAIKQMSQPSI